MTIDLTAPAAPAEENRRKRAAWRPLAAAAVAGSVLVVTGFGVFASLTASASNVTPQAVTTGTLALTMNNNGASLTDSLNMAPGDVANRYVTLTNSGSLEGKGLTVAVADGGAPEVLRTGAKAIRISIDGCSVAWSSTGTCAGTQLSLLPATVLSGLSSAVTLSNVDAISSGQQFNLKIAAALPDTTENIHNGATPDAASVQGKSASLTYTFTEGQRTAAVTNS